MLDVNIILNAIAVGLLGWNAVTLLDLRDRVTRIEVKMGQRRKEFLYESD